MNRLRYEKIPLALDSGGDMIFGIVLIVNKQVV